MSEHLTEEQQVEAIKNWWKENGMSVVLGLIIGFGGLLGWNYWKDYRDERAAEASQLYQQMLQGVQTNETEVIRSQAQVLVDNFSSTPYATLAAFALARVAVEDNDMTAAQSHLQWALDNSRQEQFRHTARLRLARTLLSANDIDAADTLVTDVQGDAYTALYAELRGDIALARGDRDTARTEYQAALDATEENARQRSILKRKLDDVSVSEAG